MARNIPMKKMTQDDFNRFFAANDQVVKLQFKNCDLNGLDLSAKKLESVIFEDCNLNDVNFSETVIEKGEFKNCLLIGVNFERSDLISVEFSGCAMQKVNLSHVRIEGIGIKESNLAHACMKSTELEFSDANIFKDVNLNGADLSGTKIGWFQGEKINFTDVNLKDASITESRLTQCNFSNALLENAELYSVAFINCAMQESVLAEAKISNVAFKESVLENADFAQAEIGYGSFQDSNLDGVSFRAVSLHSVNEFKNVSFVGADFSEAVFSDESQMLESDLRGSKGLNPAYRKKFAVSDAAAGRDAELWPQERGKAALKEYSRQMMLFTARYMGSEISAEADAKIAVQMLEQGYLETDIAAAIAACSPQALKRSEPEGYASSVLRRALRLRKQ